MMTFNNSDIQKLAKKLSLKILIDIHKEDEPLRIYGVPRGGIPVAYILSKFISNSIIVDSPVISDIIVDDLIDSGKTRERYKKLVDKPFYTLVEKEDKEWIVFPWEVSNNQTPVMDNIARIEQYLKDATSDQTKAIKDRLSEIKK